jgi:threonine dehydratase
MSTNTPLPTYDDVVAAAQRLQGVAHRTPVLTSRTMDETGRAPVLQMREPAAHRRFQVSRCLQRSGAVRPEQRKGGALAFSSGNHAQAIAQAAQLLDMPA